jgi:hypothetical protein
LGQHGGQVAGDEIDVTIADGEVLMGVSEAASLVAHGAAEPLELREGDHLVHAAPRSAESDTGAAASSSKQKRVRRLARVP